MLQLALKTVEAVTGCFGITPFDGFIASKRVKGMGGQLQEWVRLFDLFKLGKIA